MEGMDWLEVATTVSSLTSNSSFGEKKPGDKSAKNFTCVQQWTKQGNTKFDAPWACSRKETWIYIWHRITSNVTTSHNVFQLHIAFFIYSGEHISRAHILLIIAESWSYIHFENMKSLLPIQSSQKYNKFMIKWNLFVHGKHKMLVTTRS